MVKKEIIVFGTGKYFENYMACYGLEREKHPLFAVDNNPSAVGRRKLGVEIKSPGALSEMEPNSFYVVPGMKRLAGSWTLWELWIIIITSLFP